MKNDLAIIVYSCLRNADMWEIFDLLFKKYWHDCKYKLMLVTDANGSNTDDMFFDKVICKDGSWYEMISLAIHEADTRYVMLMMDDYLLCDVVDNSEIERAILDADKYNAANIRFEKSKLLLEKADFEKDSNYEIYTPGRAYSLTTQVGIWRSDCLLEYMKPEWSAWDFERKGSLEIIDNLHPLLGTRNFQFPYVEGVRKGKWMKQGIDVCKKNNIILDFNRRKKLSFFGNQMIDLKTRIYNINPSLMLKLYNRVCG